MRLSRQEHQRGLPCPPPGDLPDPGTELISVTSPPLAGRFFTKGFPCDSAGKEATCNAGDLGSILGWEDPLEKGKGTHSSILAWRIPRTISMGSQRVGCDQATFTFRPILKFRIRKGRGFPGGSNSKESACSARDPSSVPGSGRSPGEGDGNLLQYSCLENSMDRGAWQATVHRVAKSQTRLSDKHTLKGDVQARR